MKNIWLHTKFAANFIQLIGLKPVKCLLIFFLQLKRIVLHSVWTLMLMSYFISDVYKRETNPINSFV